MIAQRLKMKRQLIFYVFIWLYICLNSMVLFKQTNLRYLAILIAMAGIVLSAVKLRMFYYAKIMLILYLLLLATTIPGALIQRDILGIVQLCKITIYILILFAVLVTSECSEKIVESYMKIYLFISVLISIQCMVLFFMVWFDCIEGQKVYYETIGRFKLSFGILGYGDAINYFGNSRFLRTASFFREPSKLGAFLIAPIFWSFAKYRETRKRRYMFYEILMLFNFAATFSRAAFLAFGISCGCFLLFRTSGDKKQYNISLKKKWSATVILLCGGIVLLLLGSFLYQYSQSEDELIAKASSYNNNPIMGMINRSSTMESKYNNFFIRDSSSMDIIIDRIVENPLGYGLGWSGREQEFTNASALGFWLYSGGVLAFLVLILIYIRLFYRYCLACMYSGNIKMKALGMAFIGVTVQNMSYGSWTEPYYMLIIAMMILAVEAKEKEINEASSNETIGTAG